MTLFAGLSTVNRLNAIRCSTCVSMHQFIIHLTSPRHQITFLKNTSDYSASGIAFSAFFQHICALSLSFVGNFRNVRTIIESFRSIKTYQKRHMAMHMTDVDHFTFNNQNQTQVSRISKQMYIDHNKTRIAYLRHSKELRNFSAKIGKFQIILAVHDWCVNLINENRNDEAVYSGPSIGVGVVFHCQIMLILWRIAMCYWKPWLCVKATGILGKQHVLFCSVWFFYSHFHVSC